MEVGDMGSSAWDILRDGGETRKVQELNGEGTLGLSLPRDVLAAHGVEKGDSLPVDHDEDSGEVTVYLPES
jgi:hypothetical protein